MNFEAEAITPHSQKLAKSLQEDYASLTSNWLWNAVYCLIELPNFSPSLKWMSEKLNVSIDKIVDALEGLERLGFIKKHNNSYILSDSASRQTVPQNLGGNSLLKNSAELMQQAITKVTEDDKFTVQFFVCDREILNEYAPKFISLMREMENLAKRKNSTDIVAAQMTFAIITKPTKSEEI